MDILITQEQVPFERYTTDLNTSLTVCLFTVEGLVVEYQPEQYVKIEL